MVGLQGGEGVYNGGLIEGAGFLEVGGAADMVEVVEVGSFAIVRKREG